MDSQYEFLFLAIANLATIVAGAIGITQWINGRFAASDARIASLKERMGVEDTRMNSRLEHIEYLIHSNTQLIDHRTQRFSDEMRRARIQVESDLNNLAQQIDTVSGYLQANSDYIPRRSCSLPPRDE